ncbi:MULTISPECIES: DUF488 domain-containing protein [Pseudomonadaceae]|jgi:uncharacterized protein (DUF488 family)|uniref:DUF488 domain-containing protein n=3 Tax=Pseudomonas TaxID=286 RepID=A0A7Y8ATN7_PSETO|nr:MULTISPECIES: DUF488 domain-containing protein [Pseudomonadaceae]MBF4560332.1 DUF488 domain-containing protein [Pseudomonas sp. p50(2008)]MBF6043590.1 DUF488 domain-containing protein [Pseudomonas mucoides]MBK3915707.1 DUF488 family protein [Stutzerimonas frequens]MBX9410534.1 DUF488 domain-containing protein [Pseudomonas baetica]MCT8950795.1 DUF488 domain-containing protein [Pseudomonas iridis]|tara:strand:+ start:50 stop:481 length:432 start_codon:yes stop_codon:yes gene_type:complete
MRIFTIGFTKTTAQSFFTRLGESGAKRLIDVRLNNTSQLSGFAKRDDLNYFTKKICEIEYHHLLLLAPTADMFNEYKSKGGDWTHYADSFLKLMSSRKIENIDKEIMDGSCLLCSENKPHHCHRRLVAEYLASKWPNVEIVHL